MTNQLVPLTMKEKDAKNDKWARSFPAYVCLAFLLAMYLIYLFEDPSSQLFTFWAVIKHLSWASALFPALFFLYKMTIRDASKWMAEEVFFKLQWPFASYFDCLPKCFKKSINHRLDILLKNGSELERELKPLIKPSQSGNTPSLKSYMKYYTREDNILFEYEIFYSMYRNLTGGLIINFVVLLVMDFLILHISAATWLVYIENLLLFIVSILLMYYNDSHYAEALIDAFRNKKYQEEQENN